MERMDLLRRGFSLNHQQFSLELDFEEKCLRGSTELHVIPLHDKLTHIKLNSRQCRINQVLVNGQETQFEHIDPEEDVLFRDATSNISHHHDYAVRYANALKAGERGELTITVPAGMVIPCQTENGFSASNFDMPPREEVTSPDAMTPQSVGTPLGLSSSFETLRIQIDYILENPQIGLQFVDPDPEAAPYRFPHVYTTNQPFPGGVRLWLPCVDNIYEKCTWQMAFVVPKELSRLKSGVATEEPERRAALVACSGALVEQILHPSDSSKRIFHYKLDIPTPAPYIAFAAGPFEMIPLGSLESPSRGEEGEISNENSAEEFAVKMKPEMYGFCLPGRAEQLKNSCLFLNKALEFFIQEYTSFPYPNFKLVFVEDAWAPVISSAGFAICSSDLLYPEDVIDQVYETRRVLAQSLACQWFGINIVPKTWSDTWLIVGLSNYVTGIFFKRHLGNNEYRYRLKKDIERCCQLDVNRRPLYDTQLPIPLDLDDLDFIALKAPLVLFMLDKRMSKGGSSMGLNRVTSKILLSVMSGELSQNALSTAFFLRMCRKVSGSDFKSFAEQWVFGSGCPKFHFSYNFNRKKMMVEIYMRQESTNSTPSSPPSLINGARHDTLFTGHMTARIHEADGTPYEHVLDIQESARKFEVQFNTKYKRIRRNTKRFQKKQEAAAAAAAAAEEVIDGEEGESTGPVDTQLGVGLGLWDTEHERDEWRMTEWGQDDEDTGAASATFEWIRLDAEFEWVCILEFDQPDYMWASQLLRDRDVVAQVDAVRALGTMPSTACSTTLVKAMMDPKCFYRIRMDAAFSLAKCAIAQTDWIGLFHLTKAFQARYCYAPVSQGVSELEGNGYSSFYDSELRRACVPCVPKSNDFSSLTEYFLQKSIPMALAQVRDPRGHTPLPIKRMLLDLLRYNDNTGNMYSDNYYVSTLITAVGEAFIPDTPKQQSVFEEDFEDFESGALIDQAISEIDRYRLLDYLAPSYQNTITVSCLQTLMQLMLGGLTKVDLQLFLMHTRYGNFTHVRQVSFDAIFLLSNLRIPKINKYLIRVIVKDPNPAVRYLVARGFVNSLGIMALRSAKMQKESVLEPDMLIEEEGLTNKADKIDMSTDSGGSNATHKTYSEAVQWVRKEIGEDKDLQQLIWNALNSSIFLDYRVRKYLLLFCEVVYKATPFETKPKLKIKMPLPSTTSEPMNEDAPMRPPLEKKPSIHKLKLVRTSGSPGSRTPPVPDSRSPAVPAQPTSPEESTVPKSSPMVATTLVASPTSISETKTPSNKPQIAKSSTPKSNRKRVAEAENSARPVKVRKPEDVPKGLPPLPPIALVPNATSTTTKPAAAPAPAPRIAQPPPPQIQTQVKPASPPSRPSASTQKTSMPSKDVKKCRLLLRKVTRLNCAALFQRPVDPALDGAPDYYDIIKEPMDLGTMKNKLERAEYPTLQSFEDDFRRMIRNCYRYNSPGTYAHVQGQELEAAFEKEWNRLDKEGKEGEVNMTIVETPSGASLKGYEAVLRKLRQHPDYVPFSVPVDAVALGVPHYYDLIKEPMDFGTVTKKLRAGQYASPAELAYDARLVFQNCFTFNYPGDPVYIMGQRLQKEWERLCAVHNVFAGDEIPSISAPLKVAPAPGQPPLSQISEQPTATIVPPPVPPAQSAPTALQTATPDEKPKKDKKEKKHKKPNNAQPDGEQRMPTSTSSPSTTPNVPKLKIRFKS
ncbi:uncharacterized protein VTP21DRAFT_1986 [Calcarisporiella thermophila]|uniref:uncharacterized protein n=1 Tax=Calcarisporiella thermophila TaxID=911321 RepID=UPI003744A613